MRHTQLLHFLGFSTLLICAFTNAIPTNGSHVAEEELQWARVRALSEFPANDSPGNCSSRPWSPFPPPTECDVRLWLRSEDLRPSTVIEGDVRLFNNLTARPAEQCTIVSWSLGLRLKERGAFQYLTNRPARPIAPPGLNLTASNASDDAEEAQDLSFEANQIVFGTIKETVRDEAHESRKQWDQDLEEWAEKVRVWEEKTAHYALENETTVFESLMNMGRPETTRLDGEPNQHQISRYGVAVPSTNFMPQQAHSAGGSSWTTNSAIEAHSESRLYWYAQVLLSNGSSIELDGGNANFLPLAQTEQAVSLSRDADMTENIQPEEHDLLLNEHSDSGDVSGDILQFPRSYDRVKRESGWKLEVDMPFEASFLQGRNYTLNGKITAPPHLATEARLPIAMSLQLKTASFDNWAIDSLRNRAGVEGRLDIDVHRQHSGILSNATEVLAKAALILQDGGGFWYAPKQRVAQLQLEGLLQGEVKISDEDEDEDDPEMFYWEDDSSIYATPRLFSFENETIAHLQGNSTPASYSIQFQISVPSNALPSHHTSFRKITSSLRFTLKTVKTTDLACLHLEVLKEKNISPSRAEIVSCPDSFNQHHSETDHELSKWVPDLHKSKASGKLWEKLFNSKHYNSWGDYEEELIASCPQKTLDIAIIPRVWNEPKRTPELERRLTASQLSKKKYAPFHYSDEATFARTPVIVSGSKSGLLKAVDLVEEESRLHEAMRSSLSAQAFSLEKMDSFFPTISSVSKSNLTIHQNGVDARRASQIRRQLGEEVAVPSSTVGSLGHDFDAFWMGRFFPHSSRLAPPDIWSFPVKKGSAALDIGLIWVQNVMVDLMKGRESED